MYRRIESAHPLTHALQQGMSEREERAQLADVITLIKSRVAARISLSSQFDLFGVCVCVCVCVYVCMCMYVYVCVLSTNAIS